MHYQTQRAVLKSPVSSVEKSHAYRFPARLSLAFQEKERSDCVGRVVYPLPLYSEIGEGYFTNSFLIAQ